MYQLSAHHYAKHLQQTELSSSKYIIDSSIYKVNGICLYKLQQKHFFTNYYMRTLKHKHLSNKKSIVSFRPIKFFLVNKVYTKLLLVCVWFLRDNKMPTKIKHMFAHSWKSITTTLRFGETTKIYKKEIMCFPFNLFQKEMTSFLRTLKQGASSSL